MSIPAYEIVKALHILAIIAWIAGLLMLPRLLVYRLEGRGETALEQAMDAAALRLQKLILTPSMMLGWGLGLSLWLIRFGTAAPIWMWSKLVLVLGLTLLHAKFTVWRRKIAAGEIPISPKKLRLCNEIPFVLVVIIVFLVILEPGR